MVDFSQEAYKPKMALKYFNTAPGNMVINGPTRGLPRQFKVKTLEPIDSEVLQRSAFKGGFSWAGNLNPHIPAYMDCYGIGFRIGGGCISMADLSEENFHKLKDYETMSHADAKDVFNELADRIKAGLIIFPKNSADIDVQTLVDDEATLFIKELQREIVDLKDDKDLLQMTTIEQAEEIGRLKGIMSTLKNVADAVKEINKQKRG